MHKITLVCSGHRENGLCNAVELLKILRAINPECVFQEIRPSDVNSQWGVEAQAIKAYLASRPLLRIPVDRYDESPDTLLKFKAEADRVFAYVAQTSYEYRALNEEIDMMENQYGYKYLNHLACQSRFVRLSEIEDEIIMGTRNEALIRALKRWRLHVERREREMVRNIYQHCKENLFDTGVFLVGAAHKTDIVRELKRIASTEAILINWDSAFDGQVP